MPTVGRRVTDVGVFLALLLALSSAFYAFLFLVPGAPRRWLSYSAVFMWCPGLAALLTQALLHRTVRGLGWRWGGTRYYVLAYALPLAFCVPVYLLVWSLGLGGFSVDALNAGRAGLGLPEGVLGTSGAVLFALAVAPLGMVATLGEELGWRGFLTPRLVDLMGFTKASFVVGVIWALWHYPVIVAVLPLYLPHLPVPYATGCFTVSVVAIAFVYTWLTLRSGSVFPAALLHATSNAFQGYFEVLTKHNDVTPYFTYEYGVGFALVIPFMALVFWRTRPDATADSTGLQPRPPDTDPRGCST